jgi:hypothetical protein
MGWHLKLLSLNPGFHGSLSKWSYLTTIFNKPKSKSENFRDKVISVHHADSWSLVNLGGNGSEVDSFFLGDMNGHGYLIRVFGLPSM